MRIVYPFFLILICIPFLFSCESTKTLYYFNDQLPGTQSLDSLSAFATHHIQSNDRLAVTISSTDPNLTAYLNPYGYVQNVNNSGSATGYLVNSDGAIEFPLLGKIQVKGLTTSEASTLIKEKLSYYYKDLYVSVSLFGNVYFIVGKTGTMIPIKNERLTVFEALSQISLQDPNDMKNDVWIIREDSGKRVYAKLDLSSKSIFESQYYYLKNNDFIYLKPSKVSNLLTGTGPFKVALATALTIISLIVTLRNL
jgi:polysaccharide export outer membrane protein